MDRLKEVLQRAEATLDAEDYETLKAVVESYAYLAHLVGSKKTTIGRLRKLLFGAKTEKTDAVLGKTPESSNSPTQQEDAKDEPSDEGTSRQERPPPPGHGRNGASAYHGAKKVDVPHPTLQPGDPCPDCGRGTVYGMRRPGVLVRLIGQAPVQATVYRLQKLRCHLCGKVFTAPAPEGIGPEKFDATVGSVIALLRYGSGMPFNRLGGLQGRMGVPLPASTQWDIVHETAEHAAAAYGELLRQAAQGDVVYNDDTSTRILELMGNRARQRALAETADDSAERGTSSQRTGLYTSGIVSTRQGRRIALFFSGRKHAGENLTDLLMRRAKDLGPPIQMCDALSRNLPKELETIVANCLAHGRRQFVDVIEQFPDECRYVLEALKVIYRNDAIARERNLSPQARLQFHQANSGPTMDQLKAWLARQFDERLVEPNSSLGGAIRYLQRHWEKLTLFLRVPGAPLDNNTAERALKKAILHRRNSLFYRTENGARVGDLFMSLIYTCELCGANPLDYLTELQRHATDVADNPHCWMPWNYRQTLDAAS